MTKYSLKKTFFVTKKTRNINDLSEKIRDTGLLYIYTAVTCVGPVRFLYRFIVESHKQVHARLQ